jgi:hypothetical protein
MASLFLENEYFSRSVVFYKSRRVKQIRSIKYKMAELNVDVYKDLIRVSGRGRSAFVLNSSFRTLCKQIIVLSVKS